MASLAYGNEGSVIGYHALGTRSKMVDLGGLCLASLAIDECRTPVTG